MVSSGMVDVNCKGEFQLTPMHRAAWNGNKNVMQLLLDRGAELNAVDQDGWTPLHGATLHGHKDVVQLLLERGADPNIATRPGRHTALSIALGLRYKDTAIIIRAYGGLDRGVN